MTNNQQLLLVNNILLFIKRFFVAIVFLVLQGICLSLLIRYNKTYEAIYSDAFAEVGGQLYSKTNAIEYYFRLKEVNRQLVLENARLRNEMASSIQLPDTSKIKKTDTLFRDSLHKLGARIFTWMPAKVVNSTVSQDRNYITLHRGSNQGVKKDMAVVGPDGIVGKVIRVNSNYCTVMSLLNRDSKVSVMLKKTNTANIYIEWDGSDEEYFKIRNINKSVSLKTGDTVITSPLAGSFPSGLMVGTIAAVESQKSSNYVTLKIKGSTNFYSLQYAYIVENDGLEEQKAIEEQTLKN